MKKICAAVVLLVLLPVFFTGCGSSNDNPAEPKPTATPAPVFIDDFEDNDLYNALDEWAVSVTGNNTTAACGVSSAPPGYGSYAMNVSGTVTADVAAGSSYIGRVFINTGDPVLAVPADITAYDKMVFSLSFSGLITGTAACELDITLSGGSSGASYGLLSGFAPSFQEYSVPLEDFYISNGTLADLKSALDKVQMYITLQGGENSAADYQFYLDNIRFE